MKTLFIGASGMIGKPVAQELINAGFEISLLARDPEKLQKHLPSSPKESPKESMTFGTKIIKGDVLDRASLIEAFAGQDVVYLNLSIHQSKRSSVWQTEREGISNAIVAAKETAIRRIAYLSSLIQNYQDMNGFHWWAFDIKQKAIDKIKSSGIPYSIFYPSTFFETLGRDMIKGKRLILPSGSVAPMWFIGANDYGKQVAKALQIAANNNQEYIIQGLEPFTFNEAAKVMIENHKTKLKLTRIPLSLMKPFRFLSTKISYGWHIIEALNKYPETFESEKAWAELGKSTTTLKEYAASL